MDTGTDAAICKLLESFRIGPGEYEEYVTQDPVLVVSHNFTYYAPEEMMAVPLSRPTVLTFGTKQSARINTQFAHIHLVFPREVEDRMLERDDHVTTKHVDVADLHGAIIYRDDMLFYKHLGNQPTVLAEKIMGSWIITKPGSILPIRRGQTIGFGASSDAFGGRLWWYYFRKTSLHHLKEHVPQSKH